MGNGHYVGILTFLSFAFSVIAAVAAVHMYALLRTGEFGKSWRVLIVASVIFAFAKGSELGDLLNFQGRGLMILSRICELMFVMALAYSFYLQRKVFDSTTRLRRRRDDRITDVTAISLRRNSDGPTGPTDANGRPLRRRATDLPVQDGSEVHPDNTDEDSEIEWSRPKIQPAMRGL